MDDVHFTAEANFITNDFGEFTIIVVKEQSTELEHIALIKGDIKSYDSVLCRVSSECITGMTLNSAECDCQDQLFFSMEMIKNNSCGVVIFLRQEGRGHGLTTKIKALKNKNHGENTFSAVEKLGLPSDIRDYSIVAKMLNILEINAIDLITSNPDKTKKIMESGVKVKSVIPTPMFSNKVNHRHLVEKMARGHFFREN